MHIITVHVIAMNMLMAKFSYSTPTNSSHKIYTIYSSLIVHREIARKMLKVTAKLQITRVILALAYLVCLLRVLNVMGDCKTAWI